MLFAEQLTFLDAIAPRDARYKSVATLNKEKFQQRFCLPDEVPAALTRSFETLSNTYISVCDFYKPIRSGEHVFGFTALCFDIDCHASSDPAADAFSAYAHLKDRLFGKESFPTPNCVAHTGRGLLVMIAFKRAPRQVLPLWLQMGEGFAQAIRAVLPSYATLDSTYSDAARVVRVPGSYNTHADRYCTVLDALPEYAVYELSALRDVYFPQLNPKNYTQKGKKPKSKRPPVETPSQRAGLLYTDQYIRLHVDRLDDLVCLCEMREYHVEGMREKILFLYRYWTCFYIGPQAALQAALEMNRRFALPLPEKEVIGATKSAEGAFERWKADKRSGYNYRNSTLIRDLEITPQEQHKLKTIISKEEKARRRAEKGQWGHEKRAAYRKEQKQRRNEEILAALHAGMIQNEIVKQFHCSKRTIQNLLAKQKQPHLKTDLSMK